jgi:hypothetical protein
MYYKIWFVVESLWLDEWNAWFWVSSMLAQVQICLRLWSARTLRRVLQSMCSIRLGPPASALLFLLQLLLLPLPFHQHR